MKAWQAGVPEFEQRLGGFRGRSLQRLFFASLHHFEQPTNRLIPTA
jgi:hypothetical protein